MNDASHPAKGTLSVQLYTFRDAYDHDPAATIARIAGMGFRYIEPFGIGSQNRPVAERQAGTRALKALLDQHGLRVSSAHVGAPVGEQAEAVLDELELLGVQDAVISWPGEVPGFERNVMDTLEGTRHFAEALNSASLNAARRGIRLGYHNHWWEWVRLENGQWAYDELLSRLDPAVFLQLDAYWARVAGENPAALLQRLGERVRLLHLKDGPATQDAPQVPLGDGVLDNAAVIRAAPWIRWHVLEMDSTAGDVFADVSASAAWLIAAGLSDWS
ncbi:sugar phosphate isomerase/epimerase family protein [Deinococcus sp.]|uniref:sugar phosphate isomerase/epimerase family protein n=1 Tax=Deinococcus sp. TaxID=47478 RepID=UPI003CC699ED